MADINDAVEFGCLSKISSAQQGSWRNDYNDVFYNPDGAKTIHVLVIDNRPVRVFKFRRLPRH
jgi:hypothetical protein